MRKLVRTLVIGIGAALAYFRLIRPWFVGWGASEHEVQGRVTR